MAMSKAQIVAKVFEEAERIKGEIAASRRTIERLVDGQPTVVRNLAKSEFSQAVLGYVRGAKKDQTEPAPLRAAGGAQ